MRTIEWQDRLGQGEQLMWTGRPKPGFRYRWADVPLTCFGLFFAGIGGTIAISAFPWGLLIPHFWVGLYVAFGRFLVERIVRESTEYAITDQRVLIVRAWPTRTTTSVNVPALAGIDLTEHRDGTGTIRFRESKSPSSWRSSGRSKQMNWTNLGNPTGPSFDAVEHPHQVMDLLRQHQAPPPPVNPSWPVSYGSAPQAAVDAPFEPPAPTPPPVAPPPIQPDPVAAAPVPSAGESEPVRHGPFWRPPST